MNTQEAKELSNRIATIETKLGIVSKPEFEEGKWYRVKRGSSIQFNKPEGIGYGINELGTWVDNCRWMANEGHDKWQEATTQEVEEALIREAKRRGYKKGDICLFGSSKDKRSIIEDNIKYTEWQGTMVLSMGINVIFRQDTGEWAEIIEQPVDKFAELKEAHRNGAVIQYKSKLDPFEWCDTDDPVWSDNYEYRVKPASPIDQDIQQLKSKYPQFRFTIHVEGKV